jgi:hypothetical protein
VQSIEVVGESIVLDTTPIHTLKMRHDREDGIIEHFRSMDWFVVSHITLTLLLDDCCGKPEFHLAIEDTSFGVGALARIIAVEGGYFLAQEPGLLRSPMRNERLGLGKV